MEAENSPVCGTGLAVLAASGCRHRFDLVVFDWDGTLMDSAAAIVTAIQGACRDLMVPVPSDDSARQIIGLGLNDALSRLLPDVEASGYPIIVECYRRRYLAIDAATALFPGAFDLVAALHAAGVQLAVATGKSRAGLKRALEATGLTPYFHATRCGDEGPGKPHPDMLQKLITMLGAAPERTIMVGDTTHDLEMAAAAGVSALGVAYGAHRRQALEALRPLACLDSMAELSEWLSQQPTGSLPD